MTDNRIRSSRRRLLKGAAAAGGIGAFAGCALLEEAGEEEQLDGIPDEPFRIVHFTFESGPPAFYGDEMINAVDMMVDRINDRGGLLGEREIEIVDRIDEDAGVESMRGSVRQIAQNDEADMLMGLISSANALSVVPAAEENQIPFLVTVPGTYQLFEENPDLEYAVRTAGTNAAGAIGGARIVEQMDDVETVVTVDQDYAWGHDHRDMFVEALERIRPDIEVLETRTPEPFISDYSAHISAVQDLEPDVVFSSLWGGDISTFTSQAVDDGLFDDIGTGVFVGDTGAPLLRALGDDMPENVIMGGRGGYQPNYRYETAEDHQEFVDDYFDRYGDMPGWGAYHDWVAFQALEAGVEQAVQLTGNWPTGSQLMSSIRGLSFETTHGSHVMAQAGGRQASAPGVFGQPTPDHDFPVDHHLLTDYEFIPAHECNPPEGMDTFEWVEQIEPVE
ncbi:ABC-type transport system periplasmic substrate-binding protein (probable substrate branched-chain amino acids) [Natronomonas pharaonis DSM 2160]|uniref:ABC-type transport system periplasmic substrate-binding protein (Probable substrate branched-chain amino acids) n=1 Tax=Natronomonas pharaonis (strain ATCC 35678 / DSM 2160 / CIP 103997 / JCM 8858 / NBRC 14720 / NCIMB 2260 / Gabara) TaxID=348780 RepID=A0A1U7EXB2_NATPD|nr:ABC transporter substrate-binding protein [Natronomonas pharaonis]CAI49803.1 ABC-type transport system periplasmic substrate-binding protein (probable substrate branched-chain amino acids) [Natronomonas pharaonis DSM 2160]